MVSTRPQALCDPPQGIIMRDIKQLSLRLFSIYAIYVINVSFTHTLGLFFFLIKVTLLTQMLGLTFMSIYLEKFSSVNTMLKPFQVACFFLKRSINGQALRAYSLICQNASSVNITYVKIKAWKNI